MKETINKVLFTSTPIGCSEMKSQPNIKAIPGMRVTEAQFKHQVHDDTMTMLQTFTFKENMNIAFVPLIITEVAWLYAMKVVKFATDNRISEYVKLSRAVKSLREQYISECRKDLDIHHMNKMENAAEEFVNICQTDFVLLFYSLNNELKKHWSGYAHLNMRTEACITIVMLQLLKEHNKRMNELMASKFGSDVPSYRNPINDSLKDLMYAYVTPCLFKFDGYVTTSMKIIRNKFDKIDFEVK